MPYLLGLLAAIGVVGALLWRLNQATTVVRGAAEAVDEAHGLFRRFQWMRKANRSPLDLVEDPREAAAAMMVAVAQYDGALTEDERRRIFDDINTYFEMSGAAAEELFARARWLAGDCANLDAFLTRLARPIEAKCDAPQRRDLMAMLRGLTATDGRELSVPQHAIQTLERRLLEQRRA